MVGILSICCASKALRIASGLYPVGPLFDLEPIISLISERSILSRIKINLGYVCIFIKSSKDIKVCCRILIVASPSFRIFLGTTIKFDKKRGEAFFISSKILLNQGLFL